MAHLPFSRRRYASPARGLAAGGPKLLLALVQRSMGVWRQRQHLGRLPDHLRRDIGLSETEIAQEMQRPIWDVPHTWRL